MTTILVAAFAAGMVSTVNPCGFAMLPAYLGYFLGEPAERHGLRTGTVALSVAAGFLAVFSVAGVLFGVGIRLVINAIPWLALVVGFGLVVAGGAQITGRRLLPYLRGPSRTVKRGTPAGMFVFGVSYATASLSCTLPIFLSLVTGAIAAGSPVQAVASFLAYGLGMALVVAAITVAVAGGRRALVDRIRPLAAHMDRMSGWIMLAAGSFIVWYWATILARGASSLGESSVARAVDRWSSAATRFIGERPLLVAVVIVGMLAFGDLYRRRHRPREESTSSR